MQVELKGSCLCGNHSYKVTGEVSGFYHCHCSRCRKMTGTGHASNIIVQPGELELFGDKEEIGVFKVPDAERFASRFCKNCGGPIPRVARQMQRVVVPAGTLDHEIDFKPQCHIFSDSKVNWSCSGEELPSFSQYPE